MSSRLVSFANNTITVTYQGDASAQVVDFLYRHIPTAATESAVLLPSSVTYRLCSGSGPENFTLYRGETLLYTGDSPAFAAEMLLGDSCHHLAANSRDGLLFHAAGLAWPKHGLLLPGRSGSGKSTLAAWLVSQGLTYLSDELIFIPLGAVEMQGLARPLNLKHPALSVLPSGYDMAGHPLSVLRAPHADLILADLFQPDAILAAVPLERIVFPQYRPGSEFILHPLSKARAGLALMQCLLNARNLPEHGFPEINRLVRQIPAYQLCYSNFTQLDHWIESLG